MGGLLAGGLLDWWALGRKATCYARRSGVPTLLYIGHRVKETLKYELDFATARETWKYTSKPEAIREPVPERVRDDRKDVQ